MHYQLAEKMNVIDMFFIELTKYSKMKNVILFLIYKLQGYRPWGYPQILATSSPYLDQGDWLCNPFHLKVGYDD